MLFTRKRQPFFNQGAAKLFKGVGANAVQLFDLSLAEPAQLFQAPDTCSGKRPPGRLGQCCRQIAVWLILLMCLHRDSLTLIISLPHLR